MKTCTKCKDNKDIMEFNLRSGISRNQCKDCEHQSFKKWAIKNRESYLKRKAKAKRLNRDKNNFYERKRKFILRSPFLFGSHSLKQWEALKLAYNFTCLSCKKREPEIRLTEDHIIPISKAGSNNIDNIQPLCILCNQIKNNKIIKFTYDTSS